MRNLIRNPYIIGFLFLLPFSLAFVLFHVYTMNVTRSNLETIVELEQEHLKSEVSSYFNGIGRTLQTLTGHLEIYGTEGFLSSLVTATEQNPAIASIYYLDTDNNMINSSGYIPDPAIDFRTRPWYLSAIEAGDLAYTSAFLNVTKDKIIVSMSMPVHDDDGIIIGVLSADIDTRSITEHIGSQTVLENGFGILIDDDGFVLVSPSTTDTLTLKHLDDILDDGTIVLSTEGMQTVIFDGIHGVVFMSDVLDGNYHLGIFIPMDEYNTETAMMFNIFAFLSFLIVTVWASTAFMYRKHMVEPIEHLAYDVSLININNESHYQLPVTKNDLFTDVRKTINRVIEDNDRHINTIKEQMVALKELATFDQLTKLKNRRTYEIELVEVLKLGEPFALMMVDINGLKVINDSFGHPAGDKVIADSAKLLKDVFSDYGSVYRIGGDEFVIILVNADTELVEDLKKEATERMRSLHYRNVQISLSFGYDFMNELVTDVAELQKNAENYMYRAKLMSRSSKRVRTIETIMRTLHEKSNREQAHSLRVAGFCKDIARALQMPEDKIEEIGTAGLVHDIGKIAIEGSILNKPGKLTEIEWLEIRRHPEIGYNILSTVDELKQVALWVLSHHERYDGGGYPRGLSGNAIPIEARIIAIADAYDAMTKDRTYRAELTKEDAIAELRRCKNTQFDPKLVEVFIKNVLVKYH